MKTEGTDKIHRGILCGSFRSVFLCGSSFFLLFRLGPGFIDFLEKVDNIICAGILYRCLTVSFVTGRSKFGEAGIQFLGIIDFCDDQDDTVRSDRNRFHHQRCVIIVKTKLFVGFYHHILKQVPGFFCSVSQFAELNFSVCKIRTG